MHFAEVFLIDRLSPQRGDNLSDPIFKIPLDQFITQKEDLAQLAGYAAGVRQAYPNAKVQQFVIYCVGNLGFRVIEV